MKISKGVEWASHAVALMIALPHGRALKAESLAHYHELPVAYMAKQLQALSKAGIVKTSRGARGGYQLARVPVDISLWDITEAIEGGGSMFRCTEIRQNGPCPARREKCNSPCEIASAFYKAERAFREVLSSTTLADISMEVVSGKTPEELTNITNWLMEECI